MKNNELIEILKEFDERRVEQLNDNARNLFYAIMEIANERDRLLVEKQELKKYKSLYQNEKSHTDTLKRIIKKIEEYINKNNLFCYKYDEEELFEIITDKEAKKYLLDLLKEIK